MGIMVYSLLWVMQDFVHQPYGYCGIILILGTARNLYHQP